MSVGGKLLRLLPLGIGAPPEAMIATADLAQPGFADPGPDSLPAYEYDAVCAADGHGLAGETLAFRVLADRTIVVERQEGEGSLEPLAEAVERELPPPYRAEAVRRDDAVWAVAAYAISVVELPGIDGDRVEATFAGDDVTCEPPLHEAAQNALEAVGAARGVRA